jgi:hypothetical protein
VPDDAVGNDHCVEPTLAPIRLAQNLNSEVPPTSNFKRETSDFRPPFPVNPCVFNLPKGRHTRMTPLSRFRKRTSYRHGAKILLRKTPARESSSNFPLWKVTSYAYDVVFRSGKLPHTDMTWISRQKTTSYRYDASFPLQKVASYAYEATFFSGKQLLDAMAAISHAGKLVSYRYAAVFPSRKSRLIRMQEFPATGNSYSIERWEFPGTENCSWSVRRKFSGAKSCHSMLML